MRPHFLRRVLVLPTVVFIAAASCTDTGSSASETETPTTVAEICARLLVCDSTVYADQLSCESDWMGAEGQATSCVDEEAYLVCMTTCLEQTCEEFALCEGDCWIASCTEVAVEAQ